MRFLKQDTDNSTGEITDEAAEDLTQCPALLTGFKKVQNDVKSAD